MSLTAKKQNLNKLLIITAIFLVLFSLFALGAVKEQEGARLTYKLDSGVRRDTLNESGVQLTFNARAGTIPQVLNENGVILDLMQTVLPPVITDTRNLFNFSSLKTEVVWTALSLVLNNSNGTIDFETTIDLSNVPVLDLDRDVNISYNYIYVNGSKVTKFNTTARLILANLTFSNVRVLKDGSDCTDCTIISYSYNNLIFNAPGFTVYRAANGSILPAIRISTRVNVTNAVMNVSGDTYNGSYPSNVTIDIGNDGIVEWNFTNVLNATEQQFTNMTDSLNNLLRSCSCSGCSLSSNGLTCDINIAIGSETQGTVELSDLNISQVIRNASWSRGASYTLIDLDDYFYDLNRDTLNYSSKGNANITVAISDGVVTLSAGYWTGQENVTFYANDSLNVTNSNNVTLTVSYAAICGDGSCEGGYGESCSNCVADCGDCGGETKCCEGGCDDSDACTTDSCVDCSCQHNSITCNDNNACTDDSCSSATGCSYSPNTASCDDSNACTLNDICSGGSCSGTQKACSPIYGAKCWDGSIPQCTPSCSIGICGSCTPTCPPCTESWQCTGWSSCVAGVQTRTCTDSNSCGTSASKPAETQSCVSCTAAADCADANLCTTDSCVAGSCQFTEKTCADSTKYCKQTEEWISCDNACSPANGLCSDCSSTLVCPVDVCYGYECADLDVGCPDGSTVTCARVCEDAGGAAQCSSCDPDDLCVDLCAGVSCRDRCSGRTFYSDGYCELGSCIYSTDDCEFGCSRYGCKDEEIVPDVEVDKSFSSEVGVNLVPCINVTRWASGNKIGMKVTDIKGEYNLPEGYEMVMDPFDLNCEGDSLELTFSIPDNYIDVAVVKCSKGVCAPTTMTKVTSLECGDKVIKEWREEEVFMPELALIGVEPVNMTLSAIKQSIQSGKTKVQFIGKAIENITASLSAEEEPEPKNPSMMIVGTPLTLRLDKAVKIGTTITMPYVLTKEFSEDSLAMYARVGEDWEYIGGKVSKDTKTVIANIKDISKFVDKDNEAHLALMGLICVNCLESNLAKVYEPEGGSRDAIILVHGLGSSPETYREIIDDIRLTNQPFQTWTFGYPYDRPIEENAKELSEQIELHSGEYDRIYLIAHSLGGIIAQKALYDSFNENADEVKYGYLSKVKKVVLVGVPNEGSPGAEVYRNLFKDLVNKKTTKTLFNPNSPVIDELVKGSVTPRIPGIDYYVIAGTKPYEFDLVFFKVTSGQLFEEGVKNDGLVSIYSAQNIGGEYAKDMCKDYWELDVTHTDLIDHPLARQLIEKIIAEEILKLKEGQAVLGSNNYFSLAIEKCSKDDKYIIIGRKVERAELYGICSCGNGVCGIGENAINCPSDCAVFFSKERIYYLLVYLLLIPLLLILTTFAYREYRRLKLPLAARKELAEFDKLSSLIRRYARAKMIEKATSAYSRLRAVYIDLIKAGLSKRQEKRFYSKANDAYEILRRYEEFSAVKDKKLMQFDLLHLEAQSYIEDRLISKATASYKELRAVYVELVRMHIGLFKEHRVYRKVKDIYDGLENLRKEQIKDKLSGFNERLAEAKELTEERRISEAVAAYKKLRTDYIEIVGCRVGFAREYGLYRDAKEIYSLIKKAREERIDKRFERFNGLRAKVNKLAEEGRTEDAADEFRKMGASYIRLVELGIGDKNLLYKHARESYRLIREAEKESMLEQFNSLAAKAKEQIEEKDMAVLESYKQLRDAYISIVARFGGGYILYYRAREIYKLLKELKKEEIQDRIKRFDASVTKIKEFAENNEFSKGADEYNRLRSEFIELVNLRMGVRESRLYLDLKEAYDLLKKGHKEQIIGRDIAEFDDLSSQIKDLAKAGAITKAAHRYRRLRAAYIRLFDSCSRSEVRNSYNKTRESYRLIEELQYQLEHMKLNECINKTKGFIRRGQIKEAVYNYTKLKSMYLEIIGQNIGFIKKRRVYKDVRGVYRLLMMRSEVAGLKDKKAEELMSLARRTRNYIKEGMIDDAKRSYKRLRRDYIWLGNLLGIKKYCLYFRINSLYKRLKEVSKDGKDGSKKGDSPAEKTLKR